jgi:hypothetical protein
VCLSLQTRLFLWAEYKGGFRPGKHASLLLKRVNHGVKKYYESGQEYLTIIILQHLLISYRIKGF